MLVRTFREIRRLSPGYSLQRTEGWYRDRDTGKGIRDRHFRFDIDSSLRPRLSRAFPLGRDFGAQTEQQSIYMVLSKGITCYEPSALAASPVEFRNVAQRRVTRERSAVSREIRRPEITQALPVSNRLLAHQRLGIYVYAVQISE